MSIKLVTECNKCKKEIKRDYYTFSVSADTLNSPLGLISSEVWAFNLNRLLCGSGEIHLCPTCFKEVMNFINNK